MREVLDAACMGEKFVGITERPLPRKVSREVHELHYDAVPGADRPITEVVGSLKPRPSVENFVEEAIRVRSSVTERQEGEISCLLDHLRPSNVCRNNCTIVAKNATPRVRSPGQRRFSYPHAVSRRESKPRSSTSTQIRKALVRRSFDPLWGSYPFCNLSQEMRIVGLLVDIMLPDGHPLRPRQPLRRIVRHRVRGDRAARGTR